ncbi:hypothetical protein VN1027_11980 [Helicobacter pylori]|nr:hypothetical protein VN1027_11980 [Helicobacter pylori]
MIVESIELDDITMVGLVKLLLLWYLQTNQNLKNYLLVLAKYLNNKYLNNKYLNNKYLNNKYLNNKYLNNRDIWYCENAICDKKGTYNIEIEIELVSNTNDFRGVFGEVLDTVKDTFGNLLQLLTNLKNKEIEFDFHKKINYGLPFGIIENSNTHKIELIGNDSDFREVLLEFLMKYHNFLQTLKIQKSPMKKFHFRHQKIIHCYIKYMDILKEK